MLLRTLSILAFALAMVFASCGTSGEIKPLSVHPQFGQGRTVQLLQDEVQDYGHRVGVTAPAGIYTAAFEDEEYVYYRGAKPISGHFGSDIRTPEGGLALSKKHLGRTFIYTINRFGKPAVENRPVKGSMIVKP